MPRKAAFDRDDAIDRAMRLFWARGFHATSLKDIEAALDMRPGSIYAAFGSKEALFETALDRYGKTSGAALQEALTAAPSPIDGLASHVRNLGQQLAGDMHCRACMLMKTVLEADDEHALKSTAEEMLRATETAFADAFRAAQAAGQIAAHKDPSRLATRLQADIMGLRAYAQRSDAAARIEALADDIASDLEGLKAA